MSKTEFEYIQQRYRDIWHASFSKQGLARVSTITVRQVDVTTICENIEDDVLANPPMLSIKNAGRLMYGLVSLYGRQVEDLFENSNALFISQKTYESVMQQAELSASHIKQKRGKKSQQPCDGKLNEDLQYLLDFDDVRDAVDIEMESFIQNVTTNDKITLRESPLAVRKTDLVDVYDEFDSFDETTFDAFMDGIEANDFDSIGPLRASTPVDEYPTASEEPEEDTHITTEMPTAFSDTVDGSRASSRSSHSTQQPSFSISATNESSVHEQSTRLSTANESSNRSTHSAETDKENQDPILLAPPAHSVNEFQKLVKSRGRKRKWRDENTMLNVKEDSIVDIRDIQKRFKTTDLREAARQKILEEFRRIKFKSAEQLLSEPSRPLPPALKTMFTNSLKRASETLKTPPAKRARQDATVREILKPLPNVPQSSNPATTPETVVSELSDLESGVIIPEIVEQIPSPLEVPIEEIAPPVRAIIRQSISESALPKETTNIIKRSKSANEIFTEDAWKTAKEEWSPGAILEKILPEMEKLNKSQDTESISFNFIGSQMKNRKAAACAFASLLNLKAKQCLTLEKDERNRITHIKRGAKLQDFLDISNNEI